MHDTPLLVRRPPEHARAARVRATRARAARRWAAGSLSFLALAGCGSGTAAIELSDAYLPTPMAADASVYLTVRNTGDADDALVAVTSSAGGTAQVHETTIDADGRASMRARGEVAIPAGETVRFEPGGLHLMLVGPQPLADGDTVDLRLTFRDSGSQSVTAVVTDDIDEAMGE